MMRKFWITITKDEEFQTMFRLSMLPFRCRKAPATTRTLTFVSKRRFHSERDAILEARRLFGHVMTFKRRSEAGPFEASFNLNATDLST